MKRRVLLHPATKKLVEYGIVGLVIATAVVTGIQYRPAGILPASGILQVLITGDPLAIACPHPPTDITLTSLTITVASVEVHRTGALDLAGEWIPVTNAPKTIDLLQIKNVNQLLGSASLPAGTITSIRLNVTSATAMAGSGPIPVTVSSGKLEASLTPNGEVKSGMTTSLVVEPHVVCEGSGMFRLTPELTATSRDTQ